MEPAHVGTTHPADDGEPEPVVDGTASTPVDRSRDDTDEYAELAAEVRRIAARHPSARRR